MLLGLLCVTLTLQRPNIIIADFEQPTYGKWKVTGRAFGNGPAHGTLPNQKPVTGFRGKGLVNSYLDGDASTGSLTSPPFRIQRKFINLLVGGGYHPNQTCVDLIVNGRVVRSTTGHSVSETDTEELRPATWAVEDLEGKTAQIQILDLATGGWGHINVDDIEQGDDPATTAELPERGGRPAYVPAPPEPLYRERYRPQFHFSAKKNWLNDPNGLVYFDGEYHLFFQHNPGGIQWGDMHWGHAVSPDLVHWKELPIALSPDQHGTNYSGSAAIDVHNSAGFGPDALVAMYTGAGKPFTQCLTYSNDRGRTWTKYSGNPVLSHIVGENRDPRIFWHEPTRRWIMALYLDGDEFAIFGSPDLKSWRELSRLHLPGSSECPELFEIPIEGTHETRWIFFGGNFRYLVGVFDGKAFHAEQGPIQGDFGANFYASQTYNNTPDGRRIQIGWMNGQGPMPDMPFNQQMSFPCELKLQRTEVGLWLTRNPVKEIQSLYGTNYIDEKPHLYLGQHIALPKTWRQTDLHVSFHAEKGALFQIKVGLNEIDFDLAKKTLTFNSMVAPIPIRGDLVDLRILVDRSSIEVFAQGGQVSLTSYLPTPYDSNEITIWPNGVQVERIDAHELKSAWK